MEEIHNTDQNNPIEAEIELRNVTQEGRVPCITVKDVLGESFYNYLMNEANQGKFGHPEMEEMSRQMKIYGFYKLRGKSWKLNDASWKRMLTELLDAWWVEQGDKLTNANALLQILESEDVQMNGLAYSIRKEFPIDVLTKIINVTYYKKAHLEELNEDKINEDPGVHTSINIGPVFTQQPYSNQDAFDKDEHRDHSNAQTSNITIMNNPVIVVSSHKDLQKTYSEPPSSQTSREDAVKTEDKSTEEQSSSSWPLSRKAVTFSPGIEKEAPQEYSSQFSRASKRSSSTSTINSDVDSEYYRIFRLLTILRIIFVNIFFSLFIHCIYFLFALMLIYDFKERSLLPWERSGKFGVYIILNMWFPGFIAASHILAYYNKYEERRDRAQKMKKGPQKLCIVLLFSILFYPLFPASSYINLLWWWRLRKINSPSSTANFFATLARTLEGGFEAPSNLIILSYLLMKGTISLNYFPNDMSGNPMPFSIPMVIGCFSVMSLLLACIKLNAIQPHTDISETLTKKRMAGDTSLTLGFLPYFLSSTSVKVLSFAFLWIHLGFWNIAPIFLIWVSNIAIGYSLITRQFRVRREIRKKIKEIHGESRIPEVAVWLNSFIGMFIPCWYHEQLDDHVIEQLHDDQINEVISLQNKRKKQALQQREIANSVILLVSLVTVLGHANFSDVNYSLYNSKFDIISFNIFIVMLIVMNLECLGFAKQPNIFKIFPMSKLLNQGKAHLDENHEQSEPNNTRNSGKEIIVEKDANINEIEDNQNQETNFDSRSRHSQTDVENKPGFMLLNRREMFLSCIISTLMVAPYIIAWIVNEKFHREPMIPKEETDLNDLA